MLDITTLAAWGEFIGGIAVVVSLLYLASQIRQNSKLLRASTTSATTQSRLSWMAMPVQDPEVAKIFYDGLADYDSLSGTERQRFQLLLSSQFVGLIQEYEFHRDGIGSPGTWEQSTLGMHWQLQQPGGQQWWREWRWSVPQEFRDFVDGLIREGEAAG